MCRAPQLADIVTLSLACSRRGSNARAIVARSVAQIPRGSPRSGLHTEPKLFRGLANAVIKTQKLDSGDGRTNGQRRCQVNRIKSPNRFGRKQTPGAFNNVRTDAPQGPVA